MSEGGPISEDLLTAGLKRNIAGFRELLSCERLSGGASQETYRIRIRTSDGEQKLALRRAAGGAAIERMPGNPALRIPHLTGDCDFFAFLDIADPSDRTEI